MPFMKWLREKKRHFSSEGPLHRRPKERRSCSVDVPSLCRPSKETVGYQRVPVITVLQSQETSHEASMTANGHLRRHSVGILPNKIGVGAINERGCGRRDACRDRHSVLTPELKETFLGVKGSGCFASQGSFTIEDAVRMYEASQRRHSDYGTTEPHAQVTEWSNRLFVRHTRYRINGLIHKDLSIPF